VTTTSATTRAPAPVRLGGPLVRRLMRAGLPMGPNRLVTIRGRVSGQPRTAALAVVEVGGRRWIIGAYGEVNWVRNLRAAGEAEIATEAGVERVRAVALDHAEALAFFRDVIGPYVGRLPRLGGAFVRGLMQLVAPGMLTDPAVAAERYPVFELR